MLRTRPPNTSVGSAPKRVRRNQDVITLHYSFGPGRSVHSASTVQHSEFRPGMEHVWRGQHHPHSPGSVTGSHDWTTDLTAGRRWLMLTLTTQVSHWKRGLSGTAFGGEPWAVWSIPRTNPFTTAGASRNCHWRCQHQAIKSLSVSNPQNSSCDYPAGCSAPNRALLRRSRDAPDLNTNSPGT